MKVGHSVDAARDVRRAGARDPGGSVAIEGCQSMEISAVGPSLREPVETPTGRGTEGATR